MHEGQALSGFPDGGDGTRAPDFRPKCAFDAVVWKWTKIIIIIKKNLPATVVAHVIITLYSDGVSITNSYI